MGRFIVGTNDGKTRYQYVYGATYDEAEQKLLIGLEIESRYLSGRAVPIKKVYEEWLCAVTHRVKESTLANYRVKFERHILPELGENICCDLTAGVVNRFIDKKLAEGLSASYVRDIFTVFKSMLRYAQEEYGFKLSLKNVTLPKTEKKKAQKLDEREQKALTAYLKANMDLTAFGILISLSMGLRIGELCGLKWSDIDFEKGLLHINRTVQRVCVKNGRDKTKLIISAPKSETSKRSIAIPDRLMEYFRKFRGSEDCYILSADKMPTEPRTMQYRYKKILKNAAINNHNYHQLRHTFATSCAEKGFDIKTLSVILGHSTVSLTLDRYVHPDHKHQRRLMNSMHMLI